MALVVGLLYWLFVPGEAPIVPEPVQSSEREDFRAQKMAQEALEEANPSVTPTATPRPIRTPFKRAAGKTSGDAGSPDQVSDELQEQVTREVVQKFEDMIYLDSLPAAEEERYKYLTNGFMNSLFYLNEVAAKNVETNPENLGKAMKFLSLYAKNGNAEEIDDSIRIIRNEFPERFLEAIREISEEDALIINDIVDNLEAEVEVGDGDEVIAD